jgi:hypothetical protein
VRPSFVRITPCVTGRRGYDLISNSTGFAAPVHAIVIRLMDMQTHEERLKELDAEGVRELFRACGEYHQKHSKGPGAAAMCVCGTGCGGSKACRGLSVVRGFLRDAEWGDPRWKVRYELMQQWFDR